MPTGDLHPLLRKASEGEWAWDGMARRAPTQGPGGQPEWEARPRPVEEQGGERLPPVKKGTFRLLMVRLKIAPGRIWAGGSSWRLLKIVSDLQLGVGDTDTAPPLVWAPAMGLL